MLVVTKLYKIMSQQLFVMTAALAKYFVTTNIILLQQTFCHNKHTFVTTKDVTKMILVTAPANDNLCFLLLYQLSIHS